MAFDKQSDQTREVRHRQQSKVLFFSKENSITPSEEHLRSHIREILEELPNNLTSCDRVRLIDDLCFLLRSQLFLYAIGPRLRPAIDPPLDEPPTPVSMCNDATRMGHIFDITNLDIRIRRENGSWATQLIYGDNMLLEGRQMFIEREAGFEQSFLWFCEEASFLAYDYKARESAYTVSMGRVTEKHLPGFVKGSDGLNRQLEVSGDEIYQRANFKLKIRFRDSIRGQAGIWRVY